MDIRVVAEKENPLLKRKDIIVALDYEGKSTTSKAELQKLISEQFKSGIDSVEVTTIMSEVGSSKGKAWIKIWQEKKVPIYSEIKKEKKSKEEKKEESPKEEPSEKKEEKKAEKEGPKEEKKE
jgi:ribosomal protein S24E